MKNDFNPVNLFILLIAIYPVIKGFVFRFSANGMKRDLNEFEGSFNLLISIIFGIVFGKTIAITQNDKIINMLSKILPNFVIETLINNPKIIYITVLVTTVFVFYKIIFFALFFINKITFYPIFESVEENIRRKSLFVQRIIGGFSQIPKGICFAIVSVFILYIASQINLNENLNNYLNNSSYYKFLSKNIVVPVTGSTFAKNIPKIIDDSFKIEIIKTKNIDGEVSKDSATIVYFNGVTLEEGIKSNGEINSFSKTIVAQKYTSTEKSKAIYQWVAKNVKYDYDKAELILRNDFTLNSGAIPTFNTKKGVCFDYACLYIAMCKANGIKVRLVTGEGFNGSSWSSHAWNQVYISEEEKWVNVDTTFSQGVQNYFDNKNFNLDHNNSKIVGEW